MVLSVTLVVMFIALGMGVIYYFLTRNAFVTTIGFLVCVFIAIGQPIVAESMLKSDRESFNENLNEYVVVADKEVNQCSQDGSCFYSFKCHHWIKTIHHDAKKGLCHTKTTGSGSSKTTSTYCDPDTPAYDTQEDEWHLCPFTDTEISLTLQTSQGAIISLGAHRLPADPEAHRYTEFGQVPTAWEDDNNITQQMEQEAGVGIPLEFSQPDEALHQGHSWPVVVRNSYINYIEADRSSLENWESTHVDEYLKKGILPKLNSQLHNYYYMDRFFAVGVTPSVGVTAWEKSLQNFDSALGTLRQGDLYIVAIDAAKAGNILQYGNTVMAYWTDYHYQEHDTLSKNGIVVVVTMAGNAIQDARAFTMIKDGNVPMLHSIENALLQKPLDPAVILGNPVSNFANGKVTVQPGAVQGIIEGIALWGSEHYIRKHMTDKHPDAKGGFSYLAVDIQPSGDDMFHWDTWGSFFCLIVFIILTLGHLFLWGNSSSREYRRPYTRLSNY